MLLPFGKQRDFMATAAVHNSSGGTKYFDDFTSEGSSSVRVRVVAYRAFGFIVELVDNTKVNGVIRSDVIKLRFPNLPEMKYDRLIRTDEEFEVFENETPAGHTRFYDLTEKTLKFLRQREETIPIN